MANLYLSAGENISGLTFGGNVFGSTGNEVVTYNSGVSGIVLDQNVEQVRFSEATSAFTYQQAGNTLLVFRGGVQVASVAIQGDANGTLISFSNGTVEAKLVAGSPPTITLGGATVPAAAPNVVIPVVIDGSAPTVPQVLNLSVNQDSLNGTGGTDTFSAGAAQDGSGNLIDTLQDVDALNGDAGEDTLNATLTGSSGAAVVPTLTSIENINARFVTKASELSLANSTGVTKVGVANSTVVGTISGVGGATLSVANQLQNVVFNGSTATALTLSATNVGDATTQITIAANSKANDTATSLNLTTQSSNIKLDSGNNDAYTSVSIAATGANTVVLTDVANVATTLTVTGAGSVDLSGVALKALTTLTAGDGGVTVDTTGGVLASATTGAGKDAITVVGAGISTITTGAGNDTVTTVTTGLSATSNIDLGAGDDRLVLNAASSKGATVTGGEGADTLVVADGDFIDGNVKYLSFEVADITKAAAGTLNLDNLTSATSVVATDTFGATAITNAAAGVSISLTSKASTDTTTGADLSYALKDATGTSDSVSLSLNARDTDKNTAALDDVDGQLTVTKFTANAIETFNISSNATTTDGDLTAGDYKNTILSLNGDAVKTINLSGAADVQLSDVNAAALTKVDASTLTGQATIILDGGANAGAVAVLGGSAGDTITFTGNLGVNNIVVGNGGGDNITLAAAGTKETVRYAADGDSALLLVDTTTPAVTPVVFDAARGFDTITNFSTAEDKIELSAGLGLGTGDARTAITGKGTIDNVAGTNAELAADLGTLIGTGANFFNDGTTNRAVAQVLVSQNGVASDSILFVDVNNDGNFTNGTDNAIYLVGVTAGVVISDVVFG